MIGKRSFGSVIHILVLGSNSTSSGTLKRGLKGSKHEKIVAVVVVTYPIVEWASELVWCVPACAQILAKRLSKEKSFGKHFLFSLNEVPLIKVES